MREFNARWSGHQWIAFPTCETHCETVVEKDVCFTLNIPRCIIGV